MATARCSSPANYPEINGTTSSASRRSPTPSSIASCTTPIGWNWTGRPCVKSMPPSRLKLMLDHPRRKSPAPYLRQPSQQKGIRNDRRAQLPARPGGSTGTSRARRCASRESAPRRARVPPIDYRDGLSPCLTSHQETDITTTIQRRRQRPRHTGRNRSEQVVAIVGMPSRALGIGVGVGFCFLNIWQLAKGQTNDFAIPLVQDVQFDGVARCETTDDSSEFSGILYRLAIHGGDNVTRFNAGLGCWPITLGFSDQCAFRLFQSQAIGDILRHRLNLNTDPATVDGSLILELTDHALHCPSRDRERDADATAGWRIDRGIHADNLALHIEGRATRITLVDRRVDLNEVVIWAIADVATVGRDDTSCDRSTQTERVTDCKHPIADPGLPLR